MTITTIAHLSEHVGETVTLRGWLYNRRSSKKLHFLQLRDGSGIVQCIATLAHFGEERFPEIGAIGYESSVMITGSVRADERAPGGFEVEAQEVEVV